MPLPKLPSVADLKEITSYLMESGYLDNQFVPFKEHGPFFKEKALPKLISDENLLLQKFKKKSILYEHTFSIDYYKTKLKFDNKREVCRSLFLENECFSKEDIFFLPETLQEIVLRNSLKQYEGMYIFSFRFVPLGGSIFIADKVAAQDPSSIFLFRDSYMLYDYLCNKCELLNKRVMDIGSGSGIQTAGALLAGARAVRSVDINKRSEAFVRANLYLNNLQSSQCSFFCSSYVDTDFSQDVIISNPPYMSLPEGGRLSEDGGGSYGLEIAIDICTRCVDERIELIMILASPVCGDSNYLLDQIQIGKEFANVIGKEPLIPGIGAHDYLLEQGFDSREMMILHYRP